MYTITKVGSDVHTTKKFGGTSIPLRFIVLTSVPFWTEAVLTEDNGAAKRPLYPWMPKIA